MNLNYAKLIFGITYTIDENELKSIYRKLAILKHPDTNKSSRAKEEFQELQLAYAFLQKNLGMLPKPKPAGDTIWRMFSNNNKQVVELPFDCLINNDLVFYFIWNDKEYRLHLKKDIDLPKIIKVDGIDLKIEFKKEKGPVS